jgi:hypothetical protein
MRFFIRYLVAVAAVAALALFAPSAPLRADQRPSHTFQAVFLIADNAAPGSLEGVPENAQKALRSAASFLPYKSYRLLDSAWIRTSLKGSSRVTGADGNPLEVHLTVDPNNKSETRIVLHEFYLQSLLRNGAPYGQPLLSTSFSMELGETVVVGTSKLDGSDKALVVLLTALP